MGQELRGPQGEDEAVRGEIRCGAMWSFEKGKMTEKEVRDEKRASAEASTLLSCLPLTDDRQRQTSVGMPLSSPVLP